MNRTQKSSILKDLNKKIVFIVGPRQVGKTWLARDILKEYKYPVYLNYDSREDRDIIHDEAWLEKTDLLVLDELHKMPNWKNYLKGIYDTRKNNVHILVTGSARLDVIRQSGDSLAGRFFCHRLLPFSPAELRESDLSNDLERFIGRGGFPEPFLVDDPTEADRWRLQYIDGLIRNDILDFEKIHDFKAIQQVFQILRERVGSPISYSSIAQDIGISPNTVKKYIQIFESLYIVFRITPYSKRIVRSILKEPKIYFFDTGLVIGDSGICYENLVAVCLLKHAHGIEDYKGQRCNLHYLRTKDGLEVDFCLTRNNNPELIIETKTRDKEPSEQLLFFNRKYNIPAIQLVKNLKHEKQYSGITFRRGIDYLKELFI